jgi:mannan endo-1,4-beta-mannosidase
MRVALGLLLAVFSLSASSDSFVARSGPRLVVDGKPFRFGGANIEWLGLKGYGPLSPEGPELPSHYEIDDALATARELGALVVRSQTMGDSAGCASCLEPSPGVFNDAAFEPIDYALVSARRKGIRIIPTIIGDDARAGGTGCVYLRWRGIDVPNCSLINMEPFWTNADVISDVKRHIEALLTHVNRYTGVAYKDDPTILGWDLMNGGGSPPEWTREIAAYIRSLDRRHLILSSASNARLRNVDVCVRFIYPHWSLPLATVKNDIAECRKAGKPFVAYEYGWDVTNFRTLRHFRSFLDTLRKDVRVAGDAFWALQAHQDGHGWMPIPADLSDPAAARRDESGQWWALYYPGIRTLVTTATDMAARAQAIRAHNYAMRGLRVPRHAIPPAPRITSVSGGHVYWQGSAGAKSYTVQRAPRSTGPWTTLCDRCATDAGDGFVDRTASPAASWYRVTPYNLDGRAGRASRAVQ